MFNLIVVVVVVVVVLLLPLTKNGTLLSILKIFAWSSWRLKLFIATIPIDRTFREVKSSFGQLYTDATDIRIVGSLLRSRNCP